MQADEPTGTTPGTTSRTAEPCGSTSGTTPGTAEPSGTTRDRASHTAEPTSTTQGTTEPAGSTPDRPSHTAEPTGTTPGTTEPAGCTPDRPSRTAPDPTPGGAHETAPDPTSEGAPDTARETAPETAEPCARSSIRPDLDAHLTALARTAATGDRRALDELLRTAGPLLVRYCRGRLGNRMRGLSTPEDVAQDVVLALCTALPRYRTLDTPFMAFAYGIARNKVADAFRAAARDRSDPVETLPEETDVVDGPEQQVVGSARMAELMGLIDRLPPQQREIVMLRVVGELTAEETARTIGSTPGAVRVAQHRALTKLRAWLAEEEPA